MAAPISVIIPTLNAAREIGPTLQSVWRGVEAGLVREVIFTDGGSTDDIEKLAHETGAKLVFGPKGRGSQLMLGALEARGDWLLFLHADTTLSPDWPEHAKAAITDRKQAYCAKLRFDAQGIAPAIVAAWANLRTRLFGLPYGDQSLLISRSLYEQVGGFPDIPLMEDVAIARVIRPRIKLLPIYATTSARRYAKAGWLRRGYRNLSTLFLYYCGQSPVKLAERYRR